MIKMIIVTLLRDWYHPEKANGDFHYFMSGGFRNRSRQFAALCDSEDSVAINGSEVHTES